MFWSAYDRLGRFKPGGAWIASLLLLAPEAAQAAVPQLVIDETVYDSDLAFAAGGTPCCTGSGRIKELPEPPASDAPPRIEYKLDLALVSDFRRGGISSTDGKPALQAELAIEHPSGLHASLWGSNVAENGGANLELDATLGYRFPIGSFEAGIGAIYYVFPGVADSSYLELQAALTKPIGDFELGAAVAYTPRQKNTGDSDNIYAGLSLEWASQKMPLTIGGGIGIEHGAFGDHKLDWSLGAEYDLKLFRLGATYVDAARTSGAAHSDATLVFSAAREF